jgi:dinuclear metal center YbgI/SA1388 family protein
MTTKISEVIACIEQMAPLAYQESWDNSGVQVGDVNQEVKAVLLCVDITEATLNEAINRGANLIISHHPLIFKGIKKLTGRNYIERVIIKAIQHNIVLYSAHTNMDKCLGGVNFRIAQKLDLKNIRVLAPEMNYLYKIVTYVPQLHIERVRQAMWASGAGTIGAYDCCSYSSDGNGTFRAQVGCNPFVGEIDKLHTEPELRLEMVIPKDKIGRVVAAIHSTHPYEEPAIDVLPLANEYSQMGLGCVGDLENPITETAMLHYIKEKLGVQYIRHTKTSDKLVSRIALCGGSGAEFLSHAIREKAGIYITADVKYHDFFNTENQIVIADIGHFESEECIKDVFCEQLSKNFINFAILKADSDRSPVECCYIPEN